MPTCSKRRRASLPPARLEDRGDVAAGDHTTLQLGGLEPPTSWSTVSVPRYSWNFCGFPTIAKTLALHALVIESVSGNSWELPCGGSLVVPGSLANGGWKCAIVGSPKNWWIG